MRSSVLAISFVAAVALSTACSKNPAPDPTKPIPWFFPKAPTAFGAPAGDLHEPREPQRPVELGRPDGDEPIVRHPDLVARPTTCAVPAGYEPVALQDLLESPEAYLGHAVQVAGPLGARPSFSAQICPPEAPHCTCHTWYFLSENAWPLGEARVEIREPSLVDLGTCYASAHVPEAEAVVVWGTVSPSGDGADVVIDGICNADDLSCDADEDCPAALVCDGSDDGDRCLLP
jgi:hypothetical protein